MAKWLVILNPAAGAMATRPDEVRMALDAAGVDYDLLVPDSAAGWQATNKATQAQRR